MASKPKVQVDPELRRQLGAATPSGVGAVMRLRPTRKKLLVPEPGEARDIAEHLIARVADELGVESSTYDLNVFPNLGYFVLSGPARLIARVIDQPEIASASAKNRSR